MKRIVGLIIAVALCAGCRSSQPVYDPFLGPTTVPPPGTATPPPGQPYYGAPPTAAPTMAAPPPGSSTAPVLPRGGVPMNFSPAPAGGMSSSFTPNVSPMQMQPGATAALQPTPAAMPPGYAGPVASAAGPSAIRPNYGPPGGAAYPNPQAGMAPPYGAAPQYGTPTLAPQNSMPQPTAAQSPGNNGTVTPATHWEPAGQNSVPGTSGSGTNIPGAANSSGIPSMMSPGQSSTPIRIVAPSGSMSAPNTTSNTTPPGLFQPGGTNSSLASNNLSAPTMSQSLASAPAANSFTASPSSPAPTVVNARIPEITDLPPAGTPTSGYVPATFNSAVPPTIRPASASTTTAGSNPAAGSPPVQLTNYGYDAQYHWLKGKLEYSQSTRTWRLRYIPPDGATDNYGGSVVLADASKLNGLQPGDLVYAQGMPGAASGSQGSFAPLYNLAQIQKQ
jgi:hypothetical protein